MSMMLTTQGSINCYLDGVTTSSAGQPIMNNKKNTSVVLTLKDKMSNELLEAKGKESSEPSPSSVELWISSLKHTDDLAEDPRSERDSSDYCSEQDDLQLGAEAIDLSKQRKSQTACRNGGSPSDSEDNRHMRRRARGPFHSRHVSFERSMDSDTSSLTSCSVSSLLTARESDPEEVLKGLGFGGRCIIDNIPDRFICGGTRCEGVDAQHFISSVQQDCDWECSGLLPAFPPWVMARAEDIPQKFLRSNSFASPTSSESAFNVPVINEPRSSSPDGSQEASATLTHSRPSKPQPFPSKFGTYLEPVTEEVELSSQGSVTLSPVVSKTLSFESNRSSTLKSNSHDEPADSIMKIPSLKDLWGSQPTESEANEDSECSACLGDDVVQYSSRMDYMESEVDTSLDTTAKDASYVADSTAPMPAILDRLGDDQLVFCRDHIVISNVPNKTSEKPSTEIADSDSLTSDPFKRLKDKETNDTDTKRPNDVTRDSLVGASRCKIIPIVTISKPVERSRKVSTVEVPNSEKLLPVILENPIPEIPECSSKTARADNSTKHGKERLGYAARSKKVVQFSLYGKSTRWIVTERTSRRQIQFTNVGQVKILRGCPVRNRDMAKVRVMNMVANRRLPKQIVLPNCSAQGIGCFLDVDTRCAKKRQMFKTTTSAAVSSSFNEDSGEKENDRNKNCAAKQFEHEQSEKTEAMTGTRRKSLTVAGLCSCCGEGRLESDSSDPCFSNVCVRTQNRRLRKNGISVEKELDGLQSSLKGVKMYKAGIHLMQLASSIETVISSESRPVRNKVRSSGTLLGSIQKELKRLERYILQLQKQLKSLQHRQKLDQKSENFDEEKTCLGSDCADLTRQLLQEQLKVFNSLSTSVSPTSTPSGHLSREESLPSSSTDDSVFHDDIKNYLKKEVQALRQDNENHLVTVKNEILNEVRTEIRNCFQDFLEKKPE